MAGGAVRFALCVPLLDELAVHKIKHARDSAANVW